MSATETFIIPSWASKASPWPQIETVVPADTYLADNGPMAIVTENLGSRYGHLPRVPDRSHSLGYLCFLMLLLVQLLPPAALDPPDIPDSCSSAELPLFLSVSIAVVYVCCFFFFRRSSNLYSKCRFSGPAPEILRRNVQAGAKNLGFTCCRWSPQSRPLAPSVPSLCLLVPWKGRVGAALAARRHEAHPHVIGVIIWLRDIHPHS